MNLLGSFVIAFSMYSRIPMPRMEWTKERMRYVMCFFPLIGAVIGVLLMLTRLAAERLQAGSFFYACIGTAIPLLVTGGIHMDGFLDVTDAKSSYGTREKKLEILKDPHTGAFAIIGFGVYLLLYMGAFSELDGADLRTFACSFVLTRALSGASVVTFPMARDDGLAAAFANGSLKRTVRICVLAYALISGGLLLYFGGAAGGMALLSALCVFFYYYKMSLREFGGITGDLAGYFLQLCELVILLILALCKWAGL